MEPLIRFEDLTNGSYSLGMVDSALRLDCYRYGSLTGGAGTECSHQIVGENLSNFYVSLDVQSIDEFVAKAMLFDCSGWTALHELVMKHQSESFTWSETNWDKD